jgi:hypothetical protein
MNSMMSLSLQQIAALPKCVCCGKTMSPEIIASQPERIVFEIGDNGTINIHSLCEGGGSTHIYGRPADSARQYLDDFLKRVRK